MPDRTVQLLDPAATRALLIGMRAALEDAIEQELYTRRNLDGFGKITDIERLPLKPPYLFGVWESWNAQFDEYLRHADKLDIGYVEVMPRSSPSWYPKPGDAWRKETDRQRHRVFRHKAEERKHHFVTFGFKWFVEDLGDAPDPFPDPDCEVKWYPFFVYWTIKEGALAFTVDAMQEGDLQVDIPWPSSVFVGSVVTKVLDIERSSPAIPVQIGGLINGARDTIAKDLGKSIGEIGLHDVTIQGVEPALFASFRY